MAKMWWESSICIQPISQIDLGCLKTHFSGTLPMSKFKTKGWVLLLPITFKVISFQSWAISAAAGSNLSAVYNWVAAAAASCEFRGNFLH